MAPRGNTNARRHGMSGNPTHVSWNRMRYRCSNPGSNRYEAYAGRGIAVCERWGVFENFLADMGERPAGTSLDRVDNARGYEPGNCRWATPTQQVRNSSATKLTLALAVEAVQARGAGETCTAIAARMGVQRAAISHVVNGRNWPEARALAGVI